MAVENPGRSDHAGSCRACGAPMIWAKMPSGRANPLNADQVPPEVGKGVIAFNPDTGHGMPVTFSVIDRCAAWAEAGITFHTSHWSSCPEAHRFRVGPENQTELAV